MTVLRATNVWLINGLHFHLVGLRTNILTRMNDAALGAVTDYDILKHDGTPSQVAFSRRMVGLVMDEADFEPEVNKPADHVTEASLG